MRDLYLILHFVGLALAVGSSFSMLVWRGALKHLPAAEQKTLMARARGMGKLAAMGLVLLLLSGLGLTLPQWSEGLILKKEGLFHTKLMLVFVLALLFGLSQVWQKKALSIDSPEDGDKVLKKLKHIGLVMPLLQLVIIVIAVLTFH